MQREPVSGAENVSLPTQKVTGNIAAEVAQRLHPLRAKALSGAATGSRQQIKKTGTKS